MDILSLTINNFLTIGEAKVNLNGKGLVLIQGDNRDDPSANSNGAGKSSIPDALCWALYGKTARGVTGDSVINHKAKKECAVSVVVKDGDSEYIITRHRKHSVGKNSLTVVSLDAGGSAVDLTKGTDKLTQELVEQIIGCSHDVFVAAVYAGQEAMPDLPAMTDKQLKLLVEESAGIDRLQQAHEISKKRRQEADRKHALAQNTVVARNEIESRIVSELNGLTLRMEEWRGQNEKRAADAMDAARKAAIEAKTLKVGFDLTRIASIDAEITALDGQLSTRLTEEQRERELVAELQSAISEQTKAETIAKSQADVVRASRAKVENVKSRIGQPCGECGKQYTESDMNDATIIANVVLSDETKKLSAAKIALDERRALAESASERLIHHRSAMTDVTAILALQDNLRREKSSIEQVERDYLNAKQQAERLVEQVKAIRAEVNPYLDMISQKKIDLESIVERRDEALMEEAYQAESLELAKQAEEVFGPAGVRAHILDIVTPYLNDRTGHYLGALSDGNISAVWSTIGTTAKGEFREKFNIDVKNNKGADSFAGLSGGEKRKTRLSSAMALQDLVASRASKPINLFIADEVDHALDEAGLERLMGILDEKARERGTVLVISHNELADWCRQVVDVVKEGGYATIKGVLSE